MHLENVRTSCGKKGIPPRAPTRGQQSGGPAFRDRREGVRMRGAARGRSGLRTRRHHSHDSDPFRPSPSQQKGAQRALKSHLVQKRRSHARGSSTVEQPVGPAAPASHTALHRGAASLCDSAASAAARAGGSAAAGLCRCRSGAAPPRVGAAPSEAPPSLKLRLSKELAAEGSVAAANGGGRCGRRGAPPPWPPVCAASEGRCGRRGGNTRST